MAAVAEQSTISHTMHKRRVNGLIHESISEHVGGLPIAYFCECPSVRCFESVWLTAEEYETARRSERWLVLASGHRRRRPD
jgi:hypothetical protein